MNRKSPVTIMSQNTQRETLKDFCVAVYRSTDSEMHDLIAQLRMMVDSIYVFDGVDLSLESILAFQLFVDSQAQKSFVIVSDALGKIVVPWIHDFSEIDSIYIFARNTSKSDEWVKVWKKIAGVFVDILVICYELKRNIRIYELESTLITIIPPSTTIDSNKLDSTFMYTMLLKEMLLDMEYRKEAKTEFANFCRLKIVEIKTTSHAIDEFERDYRLHSPVWWYTKDTFIYPMLNKALRTQDCETCIKMGFFVRELHEQLKQLHSIAGEATPLFVYRGQGISYTDFEKLKKSEGGLFSFNYFVSTSYDRSVSFAYADSIQDDPDLIGLLFEMEIDSTVSSTPFASLENISYFSDSERELLFSMHAVFRIGQIQQIDNKLWQIKLTLTSDSDQQLKLLTDFIRDESEQPDTYARLGRLMLKMGEYSKAEEIFRIALETSSSYQLSDIAVFYHQLGHVMIQKGDLTTALTYIKKGFELQEKNLPSNHPSLAIPYQNMGLLQHLIGDFPTSLLYYEKSLEIQDHFSHNHLDLMKTYNAVALLYQSMGNYTTAQSYYEKVFEIQQKRLPQNHPDLAGFHINVGTLHLLIGDYQTASLNFDEAMSIQQDTLSRNHPDLATTYHSIADVRKLMGDYSAAVSSYEKALEIQGKYLSRHHPVRAKTYHNMARLYTLMGDKSTASVYLQKTLEIYETDVLHNHANLGTTYNSIGELHQSMGDYRTALSFFEKALEIHQRTLPSTAPELAASYSNIASAHNLLGSYSTALSYYQKALDIQEKTLSPDHTDLAIVYNSIGRLYQSIQNSSLALSYYEKALKIQQKTLPDTNPELASIYNNIGLIEASMKQYSSAIVYFEKALKILERTFLLKHASIASLYINLGCVYQLVGDVVTARSHFETGLEIQRETLPPNHPDFAATYNSLGYLHDEMSDYANALGYYEKAYEIQRMIVSANHPVLAIIRNNIAATRLSMLNSPAATSSFQEKSESHLEQSSGPILDTRVALTTADAKSIVVRLALPFEETSAIESRQEQETATTKPRQEQESTMKKDS